MWKQAHTFLAIDLLLLATKDVQTIWKAEHMAAEQVGANHHCNDRVTSEASLCDAALSAGPPAARRPQ